MVAGEHSGDEHAARMVRELRARNPSIVVAALGGPALAEAGAQLLYDLTESSVVGLVEVLKSYSFFKHLFSEVLRWIETYQPRAVCFVDYPGMNLRLAYAMRERRLSLRGGGKIRTLYYISPQIWAWKAGRRFKMARDLDAMAVIFPFEVNCYSDTTLSVEFVTHPFVASDYTRSPIAASAVLTSSGTMSMHCALAGIPGAIVYRANPLTYVLGKMLVKVKYLGIANLLLNEPMYPEFIQHAATPRALAADLRDVIHDPARRARTAAQAVRLREMLGQEGAGSAADWLERQLSLIH